MLDRQKNSSGSYNFFVGFENLLPKENQQNSHWHCALIKETYLPFQKIEKLIWVL